MATKTDIGPHDHSPCVDQTPHRKINPEDIPPNKIISETPPKKKKIQNESGHVENVNQKAVLFS